MSRYNKYAKSLADAFKKAREAQRKIDADLKEKQAIIDRHKAQQPLSGRNAINAWTMKKNALEANLELEKNEYKNAFKAIWETYDREAAAIDKDFRQQVANDRLLDAKAIDHDVMALLNSGVCTAADMAKLAKDVAGNATMLRLIAAKASEKAGNEKNSDTIRDYRRIAASIGHDEEAKEQEWGNIVGSMRYFAGKGHENMPRNPDHTAGMMERYDELMSNTLEQF